MIRIILFSFLLSCLLDYLGHGIGHPEFWIFQLLLAGLIYSCIRYGAPKIKKKDEC